MQSTLKFLQGGGELGRLTREYDWTNNVLGSPDKWPQSLKLTLSTLLNSKFPMFLFWGDELIQFYNDAYRPSLGKDGKHPTALGQKGVDCWQEIWDIIYPLIKQVRETGEATWSEDQLIPIYRNGKIEDVYWTFGYSPVYSDPDSDKVDGVLVVCTETTGKVLANKALEMSELSFRSMADNIPNLAWMADAEGWIYWYNNRWYEFTGTTKEQMQGWGWQAVHDPHVLPHVMEKWQKSLKSGIPFEMIFPIRSASGEFVKFLTRIEPVKDRAGKIQHWFGTNTDISKEIRIKEELQESEKKLRSIIDAAPPAIALFLGRDFIIQMPNKTFIEIVGKGADIEGKPLREVMPELEMENQPFLKILEEVYSTGETFTSMASQVNIIRHGQRTENFYNISYSPLYDTHGKIYGILDVAIDVTEEVKAKQKIIESEKNLRNTILQAPVAMAILRGENFVVEIANERMYELWGKPEEVIGGRPIFEGLTEAKDQGFEKILRNVYTTGESFSAEGVAVRLPRNNNVETVYINLLYEPYRSGSGDNLGVIAMATDVTPQMLARHKIEQEVSRRTGELAEANENLKRSNSELEQFAHIASHDLQEPLRKITIYADIINTSLPPEDKSRRFLEKIIKAASRMHTLIKDVLTFSAVESVKDQFADVDLNTIMTGVTSDFELLLDQKHASFIYADLPVLEAIPLQMSQLFSNLLSNALKFTNGVITPVIKLEAEELSKDEAEKCNLNTGVKHYKLKFSDNGIGFDTEHAEKIFSIFQRLHRKDQYEGTGIGLAICKKIIQNHHGHISAFSDGKNGSTFEIILPAKQEHHR